MEGSHRLGIDPGAISLISHPATHRCGDYYQVFTSLLSHIKENAIQGPSSQTYALARLRSRIPYCCYRASHLGPENLVSLALTHRCNNDVLAWLCRGEIGRSEVASLDAHSSYKTLQPGYESLVACVVLPAENGYRLDRIDEIHFYELPSMRRSVLRSIIWSIWNSGLDALPVVHCLSRLQRYAADSRSSGRMPPSLRYFLTGHGFPDAFGGVTPSKTTEFWTTALHECVDLRYYDAVEALVLGGFEVNGLDANGKTALQILFESIDDSNDDFANLNRDRIIALLQQRPAKVWHPEFIPSSSQQLPMGWSKIQVRVGPTAKNTHTMYQERHFGSLTFQRPKFSFFSDQRLALGFRKVSVPGQTYYLDLLRFIIDPVDLPDRSKPIAWTYSYQWYAEEAARSDELELYTVRWIAVSTAQACWRGIQLIPSIMAGVVTSFVDRRSQRIKFVLLVAEFLFMPLIRYSPYAFIPLSCLSMQMNPVMKTGIDLAALAALCHIMQGALSYFLTQDGSGYAAASLCNFTVDFFVSFTYTVGCMN